MTIICVKDGVVAADGSSWQGSALVQENTKKIVRSIDGAVGAAAGLSADTHAFRRWFAQTESLDMRSAVRPAEDPLSLDKDSGFKSVWAEPTGEVWFMDWDGKPYSSGRLPQAIGGPWEMALGAMFAGASAEDAVRICIARHDCAGGEVFVERLMLSEAEASIEDEPPQPGDWRDRMGLA